MRSRGAYPRSTHALELLLQGYLTLDWPEEYGNVWAAVDDFASSEPSANQVVDEIDALLGGRPSERRLRVLVVDGMGCGYLPDADGYTMKAWLRTVRDRVEMSTDRRS